MKNGRQVLLFLLCFLFSTPNFAAIPIQGTSLAGLSATDARKKVLAVAESYLGTRYRYGGTDRGGMDCSGFVYTSFRESLNYSVPRTADGIYDWTEKISAEELQPGDLVFFVTAGSKVSHVGIYTGGGRFIHAASEGPSTGVIYSSLDESYWRRTYRGAGRALPWNAAATWPGQSVSGESASVGNPEANAAKGTQPPKWEGPGFFAGFGAAWTWGGFFEGAPSLFRGISSQATAGYKWNIYRVGLELRPEWDNALGVFRLPLVLSAGTDAFQIYAGPVYTFGEPSLSTSGGERSYTGGFAWLGELGFSSAFPSIRIKRGLLSLYGEMAWQPYRWEEGEDFSFKPDITANIRVSTGIRYFWKL